MNIGNFYSHGKLLLTGEYAVLDGAKAIAFPCKLGQKLSVEFSAYKHFEWVSFLSNGEVWKAITFTIEEVLSVTEKDAFKKRLFTILNHIYIQRPELFDKPLKFSTSLEFHKDWGLGSSSTLINNLSQWANVDPYKLLANTFGGSGYDIAAAQSDSTFLFQKKESKIVSKPLSFPEPLKSNLFFIYLNRKQNSRSAIKNYRNTKTSDRETIINEVSKISEQIEGIDQLKKFEELMNVHESLISRLILQTPVKEYHFKDYNHGTVKSLGAWGGDFVLVTAKETEHLDYFKSRGFDTIFSFDQIILDASAKNYLRH